MLDDLFLNFRWKFRKSLLSEDKFSIFLTHLFLILFKNILDDLFKGLLGMPFFDGLINQQFKFLNILLSFLRLHFKLILIVKNNYVH